MKTYYKAGNTKSLRYHFRNKSVKQKSKKYSFVFWCLVYGKGHSQWEKEPSTNSVEMIGYPNEEGGQVLKLPHVQK